MAYPSAASKKNQKKKKKGVENVMTVAAIRPGKDQAFIKVTFLESQRFYKLPNDSNPVYIDLLKASEKNKTAVVIKRIDEHSDVILSVQQKK
jgi:hypothetical protein